MNIVVRFSTNVRRMIQEELEIVPDEPDIDPAIREIITSSRRTEREVRRWATR